MDILFSNDTGSFASKNEVGGKAFHLKALIDSGFQVPDFVVIPAPLLSSKLTGLNNSAEIREKIQATEFDIELLNKITSYFPADTHFAVRSSGIAEDGSALSYAGQFETCLFVNKDELATAIKKVWLSAYSDRVEAYNKQHLNPSQNGIAVIIQHMLHSEASGVAFGINPVSGNRNEKLISAVWGIGEGLVSGELNADNYYVTPSGIRKEITTKQKYVDLDFSGKKLKTIHLLVHQQNIACLSDSHILEISEALNTLFKHFHQYQDIEFAIAGQQLYLLQTRPITTLSRAPDISGEMILWDNSNIIESYPGLTSPLTFSFIRKMYEAVYRQFAMLMGVSEAMVEEEKLTYANMLGLINGRVYYNLLSWYKALAQLPGFSLNASFMEKMMGVKEKFVLEKKVQENSVKAWWRVTTAVYKILKNHNSVKSQRDEFLCHFNAVMAQYEQLHLSERNAETLMNDYLAFEETLVKKWKAPLVNDFFAMIYFGVLQKLVQKYKIDETGTLHNDLVSGAGDIISTEPITLTLAIADQIHANKNFRQLFLLHNEHEIWQKLHLPEFSPVKKVIDSYIRKWGDRCVGELKLETVTYGIKPQNFIRIVKSYIVQNIDSKSFSASHSSANRIQAETKVKATLKGKWLKQLLFNYVLKKARYLVSNRENLRFERTRGFGMVRKIFIEIGNKFYAENCISQPEDIFYLTQPEIFDFIKGTAVTTNLKQLIELRKAEYKTFENRQQAERIKTYGMVYAGNSFTAKQETTQENGDINGIACCAGIVTAKVQVINSPEEVESLNGAILVTSSTDPGWVTLFPTCSGILVERGSLLSHSAIVSREMNIPCIVGITGLLQKLKTGDTVIMDGATGTIKITAA